MSTSSDLTNHESVSAVNHDVSPLFYCIKDLLKPNLLDMWSLGQRSVWEDLPQTTEDIHKYLRNVNFDFLVWFLPHRLTWTIYALYCHQPLGGNWDALASLLGSAVMSPTVYERNKRSHIAVGEEESSYVWERKLFCYLQHVSVWLCCVYL